MAAGVGRPRAVTFDCWQTLIHEANWERAHALRVEALVDAARLVDREVPFEQARLAFDTAWGRHMELWAKQVTTGAREVAHWALESLEIDPHGRSFELLFEAFEEASHSGEVSRVDGALETLSRLDEAGVGCALICDTGLTPGRVVRKLLERQGLLAHLSETIFSDEWSLSKPHPRVFTAALAALDCEPQDAVHVGDLRRTDIAGARGVGMQTVRIRAVNDDTSAFPEADHVADSHADLRRILGVDGADSA